MKEHTVRRYVVASWFVLAVVAGVLVLAGLAGAASAPASPAAGSSTERASPPAPGQASPPAPPLHPVERGTVRDRARSVDAERQPAPPLHAMERGRGGEVRPAAATGRSISYSYDANGRLTGVNYSGGNSISYTYDNNGNLTNIAQVGLAATATTTPGTATPTPGPGTPTASPTPTRTPVATATAVATIAPTPGATQVISIPGLSGNIYVPGDAAGTTPLTATIRVITHPTNVPISVTVLAAVEITFADATSGAAVTELTREVVIELSYAGLNLTEAQLAQLTIYNASRGEYLATTLDRSRQVAIARTPRFSVFTLALVTAPVPRLYLPVGLNAVGGGW